MPWLRNEDAALKARLQGLFVADANSPAANAPTTVTPGVIRQNGGREVGVRYRLPHDEIANLTYPIIIIEHAGVYPAQERMHQGIQTLSYAPEGLKTWWAPGQAIDVTQSPYQSAQITPYNLDYQITVYGRFWAAHIQPLMGQLALLDRLPAKHGALFVPQDNTFRTMRLLGGPEEGYGTDEDGKILSKVVYRIRVFSELVEGIQTLVAFGGTLVPVTDVDIDLSVYSSVLPIDLSTPAGIEENIGIMSIGATSTVNVQT
jgi:hypothetical protein